MQRVTVANIQPGMVTARNVYDADGRVLVRANLVLVDNYVKRLKAMDIGSIYVKNPMLDNISVPELLAEETRIKAIQAMQFAFKYFQNAQEIDVEPIRELANKIVEEVILNRDQLVQITDIRTYEDYLYAHSVNVAVLSAMIGLNMEYNEAKLRILTLGALLHDIGQTLVPSEILNKPGKLSSEAWATIKKHPELGFEALRKKDKDMSIQSAHIAFQHHENFDGSGYPRGLKGEEIHEFARITAVANIYDALVADRPFRKGFLPHEACEMLMTMGGKYLDPKILEIFLSRVASYPIGSVIKLSSGEIGIITAVKPRLQSRPIVTLLTDCKGSILKEPAELDLTKHLTTFVSNVLPEEDVIKIGNLYAKSQRGAS